MRQISLLFIGILILGFVSCKNRGNKAETLDNYVVIVSFDGFRWDYADLYNTPNLDQMEENGVRAVSMIPSFPTKTFPNHYTLATGLYPDHHGIINNSFYAEDLGGIYRMGDAEMVTDPEAYFGEPIWVTAEEQGVRSASYFWVGSEAPVQGRYPSYWEHYNGSVPYPERVDQVIRWLELPLSERPGLVLVYFDEPDQTGHDAGPVSPATGKAVENLDLVLGKLRSEIAALPYGERVNLIVLSDHGMGPVSPERYVNLRDYVKEEWMEMLVGGNPFYLIDPAEGCEDSITMVLNQVEGLSVWKKGGIPQRLHFGNSPRFPGMAVLADSLWSIGTRTDPSVYTGGNHGYDNNFTDMHTIFYAEGPAFKKGFSSAPFSNVEVYGIVAHILGLKPASTDGNLENVRPIFRNDQSF